jgi:hypothetical protein
VRVGATVEQRLVEPVRADNVRLERIVDRLIERDRPQATNAVEAAGEIRTNSVCLADRHSRKSPRAATRSIQGSTSP